MQDVLKHFLPDTELTPEALRSLALECKQTDALTHATPASPISLSSSMTCSTSTKGSEEGTGQVRQLRQIAEAHSSPEDVILQDALQLHQRLGCLLADSQGRYRKPLLFSMTWWSLEEQY